MYFNPFEYSNLYIDVKNIKQQLYILNFETHKWHDSGLYAIQYSQEFCPHSEIPHFMIYI